MAPKTAAPDTAADASALDELKISLELFLSTDGKHTVHVTSQIGSEEDVALVMEQAKSIYDDIFSTYGAKPVGYGNRGGGNAAPARGGQAPAAGPRRGGGGRPTPTDVEPFCEDCGTEIRGFTDKQTGKVVSGLTIAAARKRDTGRVTCGKGFCKQEGETL